MNSLLDSGKWHPATHQKPPILQTMIAFAGRAQGARLRFLTGRRNTAKSGHIDSVGTNFNMSALATVAVRPESVHAERCPGERLFCLLAARERIPRKIDRASGRRRSLLVKRREGG